MKFAEWLAQVAKQAPGKPLTPSRLQYFIVREGLECREETVRRWMTGVYEPKVDSLPYIVHALQKAVPDVDVPASFLEWLSIEREHASA